MSLINKLKAAGATGIIALASGCGTIGPDGKYTGERIMDSLTELSLGSIANANAQLAETPQQAAAWSAIGQTANNAFYRDTQIEAAKAGRSEVNVNVGTPQSNDYIVIGDKKIYGQKQPDGTTYYPVPQDPESQRIIQERLRNLGIEKPREEIKEARLQGAYLRKHSKFEEIIMSSYNYISDFNKNGIYDFPEEHIGLKDKFSRNEKITVHIGSPNLIPNISYKLLNRNGEIVDKYDIKEDGHKEVLGIIRDYNHANSNSRITLTLGNYAAFWYSGDEFLGKLEFEVYDEK